MKPMLRLPMRTYQGERDDRQIREFLRHVSLLNDRHEYAWSLLRWDYWVWHVNMNICHMDLQDVIYLWESGRNLVAMLNPDTPGEAFFQIHPSYRSADLLKEMLDAAEDTLLKEIFTQRGYVRSRFNAEHMRRRSLPRLPDSVPPSGYSIRALGDESELPARSWLSWKVFHPDEPDEKYQGWQWYKNVRRVPLYNRDLDIVAVAPDGELAAFCTVWVDDVTRTAVFEPVGTHPNHQKRGLGKAVMSEGLCRAQKLGATLASVSSYSQGAHALYASMGFTEFDLLEPWTKAW